MTPVPAIGDLVVYRDAHGAAVARVDLVREHSVTVFPWRQGDRRWLRMRARIERRRVMAVLPAGTDPIPVADMLNVLGNRRQSERRAADRMFDARVAKLVSSIGVTW